MFAASVRQRLPILRSQTSQPFSLSSRRPRRSSLSKTSLPKSSILRRAWDAYADSLRKRPLPTKCFATALIFFTSDSVTQYITHNNHQEGGISSAFVWDVWRAASGAIFGILATTYLHNWWHGLERVCERIMPSTRSKLAHTVIKLIIDQGLGAPMYIFAYYTITNFLLMAGENHMSPHDAWIESTTKARAMWWTTMQRHWRLWPIVHFFNFYYVPLHHRVLIQNLVLVGWSGCKFLVRDACQMGGRKRKVHCFLTSARLLSLADLSHLNNGGFLKTTVALK